MKQLIELPVGMGNEFSHLSGMVLGIFSDNVLIESIL